MSQARPRLPGAALILFVILLLTTLAGTACTVPGFPGPTPTISSAAKTAVAVRPLDPTPRVSSHASASPTGTQTEIGTPVATRARVTPTPKPGAFVSTESEPCRTFTGRTRPIPDKKTTVENIGQAYRCLLMYYVDKHAMDHRVLLDGAWVALAESDVRFTAEDLAPLDLVDDRDRDWEIYAARFTALAAKYSRQVETSTLARLAIGGMALSLNDNHVYYLEPKHWRRNYAAELGVWVVPSAGFEPMVDEASGKFFLYTVVPNGPAARAGLQPGDILETVSGYPVGPGQNNRALGDLLAAPLGTGAMVQVTRPATGETIKVLVKVAEVEFPVLEARILRGNIGYIRLRHFSFFAGEDFADAAEQLKARGVNGIIFDVRQNPGGSIAALTEIMSHFTHEGPIAVFIDENGEREEIHPDPDIPLLNLPWVVLCDGGSASSSDITAAVAQDRGGHLVGEKSAGALGGALYFELEDGSALEITVVRVLGPNGQEINEIGVTPHHIISLTPADLSAGVDPQLEHAIVELGGR